jgi:hypothetical protein
MQTPRPILIGFSVLGYACLVVKLPLVWAENMHQSPIFAESPIVINSGCTYRKAPCNQCTHSSQCLHPSFYAFLLSMN